MEDNLARELEVYIEEAAAVERNYAQPFEQPVRKTTPRIEPIPQAEPVSRGLTKFETTLVAVLSVIVFAFVLLNVHSSLQLSNASRELQDVNSQISQTNIEIENLQQQSHELSRYDRVNEIAKKYGLELQEDNIINIAPQE